MTAPSPIDVSGRDPVPDQACRVAVVGTHGFGLSHLRTVAGLADQGLARLVAVADVVAPDPGTIAAETAVFSSLGELLSAVEVDIVTIATPIHTHLGLATEAMDAGADVLLEKPPTASRAEFDELVGRSRATGRSCQIGFQSLGSLALPALDELVGSGRLGTVVGIGGYGAWVRTTDYWSRSAWAGRRRLGDREVVDGAVTNAFAHASATALRLAGSSTVDDVASVGTELYRANDIEADDTSVVDIRTAAGLPVVIALTLSAAGNSDPTVTIYGSKGRAVLSYTTDEVELRLDGSEPEHSRYGRTGLLANLIAHRADPAVELLAPVERTGAFVQVLEAVRTAAAPQPIPDALVDWVSEDAGRHPVVRDVEHWLRRASTELRPLRELGAPWIGPA
jgi:predicted dehydrogenase